MISYTFEPETPFAEIEKLSKRLMLQGIETEITGQIMIVTKPHDLTAGQIFKAGVSVGLTDGKGMVQGLLKSIS